MTTTETEHHCRHRIRAITDEEGPMVAYVGWDKALNTFFLQVGPPDPDDPNEIDGERMVKSAGTKWREIPSTAKLVDVNWNGPRAHHNPLQRMYIRTTSGEGAPWAQLEGDVLDHLEEQQRLNPASTRRPMRGLEF